MREYSNKIALIKNSRGIYSLDTSIGCASGMLATPGGCYNDCYAAKSAKLYGYDFSKTVLRKFTSEHHKREIIGQINKIPLPFIRIGTSGDPSENWAHTLEVCKIISRCKKQIVIITRHWTNLSDAQLIEISKMNICINTSVSALDDFKIMNICLTQYNRLKPFCKSILRVVSCDFNLNNEKGRELSVIQDFLFKNETTIDTVLRVNKRNKFVVDGVINISESTFLGKKAIVSKFNKKTYFGKCSKCTEMCGQNMSTKNFTATKINKPKQLKLFK